MRRIRSPPTVTASRPLSLFRFVCTTTTILLIVLTEFGCSTNGLKLTSMSAPVVADLRKPMNLDCQFDMEGEELNSVKWYKDEREFFRYMPNHEMQTFPVAGVHLVPSGTDCGDDHCSVTLSRLTREHSGGAYKCEISTEGPTFYLLSKTTNITVAAPPEGNPRIEGLSNSYVEGDIVSAKCISPPADPAPILTWYINGQQAPMTYLADIGSTEPDSMGLSSRSVQLRFQVERKVSRDETVELRCVSSLPGVPLPPQEVKSTFVFRSLQPQIIKNQKLHWYGISSAGKGAACEGTIVTFITFLFLAVVRWMEWRNNR